MIELKEKKIDEHEALTLQRLHPKPGAPVTVCWEGTWYDVRGMSEIEYQDFCQALLIKEFRSHEDCY